MNDDDSLKEILSECYRLLNVLKEEHPSLKEWCDQVAKTLREEAAPLLDDPADWWKKE